MKCHGTKISKSEINLTLKRRKEEIKEGDTQNNAKSANNFYKLFMQWTFCELCSLLFLRFLNS